MTTSPVMGITEELLGVLEAEANASLREDGTGFVERVTGFSVIDLVAEVRRLRAALAQQSASAAPMAQEPVVRCPYCAGSPGRCDTSFPHPPAAEQPDTVAVPRELLAEAESIIDSYAEALKASHAPGGDWDGEEAAHDEYEIEAGVASKLRELLKK